jgi:spore germination protein KC
MKKIKLLILFIVCVFSTGCYNYRELSDMAITSAVGLDKSDKGIKLSLQFINTQKNETETSSSGSLPNYTIYTSEGKTMQEAFRKIVLESPKRVYGNHIALFLIGEELAKDGIFDILDFSIRDTESRKQFLVAVVKDNTAENVLTIINPLENLNSNYITESIKDEQKFLGSSISTTFEEMVSSYLNKKTQITIPSIKIQGSVEEGKKEDNLKTSEINNKVVVSNMAYFKDDKLVDYLTEKQGIALSFLRKKIVSTIISFKYKNDYIVSEVVSTKTKYKFNNNKITVTILGNANLNEITCKLNLEKNETIDMIESKINKKIKKDIKELIDFSKEKNIDFIGLKDLVYKNQPKYYRKYKPDLKDIDVKVKVNINIRKKGNLIKVIKR